MGTISTFGLPQVPFVKGGLWIIATYPVARNLCAFGVGGNGNCAKTSPLYPPVPAIQSAQAPSVISFMQVSSRATGFPSSSSSSRGASSGAEYPEYGPNVKAGEFAPK